MRRVTVVLAIGLVATGMLPGVAAASSGPARVRDLGSNELVQTFVPIGDRILFTAEDDTHGRELFISDGTSVGTHLVKDIAPGAASSVAWSNGGVNVNTLTAAGIKAYFLANDGTHGRSLYVTDGSEAGTIRLMRRRPCADGSNEFTVAGERMVFAAATSNGTCNVYATDGTVPGTVLALSNVATFAQPRFFKGLVFFVAGAAQNELWKTAALPGGTARRVRAFSDAVNQMTVAGRRLYFTTGTVSSSSSRLWKSDGTRAGTRLVHPTAPLGAYSMSNVKGVLVFGVADYEGDTVWRKSLWRTDGSAAGTYMLTEFGTDKYSGISVRYVAGDRMYLIAGTDLPSYGLWVTNGRTSAGTHFVAKVTFFDAAAHGRELYGNGCYRDETTMPVGCGSGSLFLTSDGTDAGTRDIPGAVNLLGDVAVVGDTVYLNVNGELFSYTI
jgi:ELWxxDGT repeat protein